MRAAYAFTVMAILLTFSLSSMPNSYSTIMDPRVIISTPSVSSMENAPITLIQKGQQVFLSVSITNEGGRSTEFIAIIEVRDKQGTTVNLQFQKGTSRPFDSNEVGFSWSPQEVENYTLRTFLISDFQDPNILTPVAETQLLANSFGHFVVIETDNELQPELESTPSPDAEVQQNQLSIAELKQYALERINEDRKQYGLPPVDLSNNVAAQAHADDLYKTKYHSTHWTSDGMKPYMRYTVYGGDGAVAQNVHAGQVYFEDDIERCESGNAECEKVDIMKQIYESQYVMMYEDKECCDDGHRYNILDPHHTHVSIGIAYHDYYFAYVQNFENIYIEYDNPIEENSGYVELSGTIHSGKLYGIRVYYDEIPTIDVYNKFRDENGYSYGDFIAAIVEPAGIGYYYKQPSDYTLIEAKQWKIEGESFDLEFNLRSLMSDKDGVYTLVILLEDEEYDVFEATSHSFFER